MRKITIPLIIITLILNACSTSPEFVKLEDSCFEEYKDKTIITEGVLYLPSKMTTYGSNLVMGIKDENTNITGPRMRVFASVDETKNCMRYLPISYSEADVKIFDNNGGVVKLGDRIRITGEITGATQAWCDLWIEKIEKINSDI